MENILNMVYSKNNTKDIRGRIMAKNKVKEYYEYICPKCRTKIKADKEIRVPSLYCRNCMKTKQLSMLRLIVPSI